MTGLTLETRLPGRRRRPRFVPGPSRAARMLALAHHIEQLIKDGELADYADAARRLGLTRARLSQLMNLLLLSPRIQGALLVGDLDLSERQLRPIAAEADWQRQVEMWRTIHE